MQRELIAWTARELHLPLGAKRELPFLEARDGDDEGVAAWEETPGLEAQPSSLSAPGDAVEADAKIPIGSSGSTSGFLAAKSPLPPTRLGKLVNKWKTRGQGGVGRGMEKMSPKGAAVGNRGRAEGG